MVLDYKIRHSGPASTSEYVNLNMVSTLGVLLGLRLMRCPKCHSPRVQRGYHDAPLPVRMLGLHELLCNRCGHEFKGFDPFAMLDREPSVELDKVGARRRAARYNVHIPVAIALVEGEASGGTATYGQVSRGHCDSISKMGMTVSFVGSRFSREQLESDNCLLFVRLELIDGLIESVIRVISRNRVESESGIAKWVVGGTIRHIDDENKERLTAYLEGLNKGSLVLE